MIHLIIAGVLVAALYVVLVETLFKKSKCKGTADMTGKTAIITGEVFDKHTNHLWKMTRSILFYI